MLVRISRRVSQKSISAIPFQIEKKRRFVRPLPTKRCETDAAFSAESRDAESAAAALKTFSDYNILTGVLQCRIFLPRTRGRKIRYAKRD